MRSTEASETAEIGAAQAALRKAEASFAIAHEASVRAGAGRLDPLTEAEDNHWVRVELTRRRERDAQAARARGRARRAWGSRWRAFLRLGRAGDEE